MEAGCIENSCISITSNKIVHNTRKETINNAYRLEEECSTQYTSPLSFEDNFPCVCRDESFIPYIDGLPAMKRNIGGPFMMPIVDKFADMGTILIGKVESGECKKGKPTHFLLRRGSRQSNTLV